MPHMFLCMIFICLHIFTAVQKDREKEAETKSQVVKEKGEETAAHQGLSMQFKLVSKLLNFDLHNSIHVSLYFLLSVDKRMLPQCPY